MQATERSTDVEDTVLAIEFGCDIGLAGNKEGRRILEGVARYYQQEPVTFKHLLLNAGDDAMVKETLVKVVSGLPKKLGVAAKKWGLNGNAETLVGVVVDTALSLGRQLPKDKSVVVCIHSGRESDSKFWNENPQIKEGYLKLLNELDKESRAGFANTDAKDWGERYGVILAQ